MDLSSLGVLLDMEIRGKTNVVNCATDKCKIGMMGHGLSLE